MGECTVSLTLNSAAVIAIVTQLGLLLGLNLKVNRLEETMPSRDELSERHIRRSGENEP
jgi:hypothetical protein